MLGTVSDTVSDTDPVPGPACARCGTLGAGPPDGLPVGWSLAASERGVDRLCAACTRENVRSIEAKLDEDWW
jgi:hypothetical protein